MQKVFLTFLVLFLCNIVIYAQKLNVESFVVKSNDITARTHPRQDINGNDCALIKVRLATNKALFSGNVVGNVDYNTSEYLVYMAQASKKMMVKLEGYLPLEVVFQDYGIKSLEPKTVYLLTISGVMSDKEQEPVRTKTGWIILDSEPSGASVYINNEFVGNTPLSNYKQAYGTYQYRLENPNYHPATGVIELNAGRFEQKVVLKPAFGSIFVNSSIAGAKIILDGKQTGKQTPATLTEIPSGSHTISLQMDKYAPKQQEVTVEDGQTANVSLTLDARFAMITINSLDRAEIYSNGKLLGKGCISEDMMEGYYDLEARLDHHKSVTKQIHVVAGQSQDVTLNPIPKYGTLDIMSTPHDATITIDGKEIGKTPLTIDEILEGEHIVQLSLGNYQPETKKVTIIEKQTESLEFSLSNFTPMYYYNLGDKSEKSKDYSQAAKWYRKAAEQGHSDAQANLGVYYGLGLGVTKDYQEAFKWYKLSAEQGNKRGQYGLGTSYQLGHGVKIDYSEALKWYLLAADQGYREAYNQIGGMYYNGLGVTESDVEAVKWFTKAAEKGLSQAQYTLGRFYEHGVGVTKNYEQALKWYSLAAKQGDQDAIKCINDLKAKMR